MEGWVATAALIAGYDAWVLVRNRTQVETDVERRRRESMSACWRRWLNEPVPRVACGAIWFGITAHLFFQKGKVSASR